METLTYLHLVLAATPAPMQPIKPNSPKLLKKNHQQKPAARPWVSLLSLAIFSAILTLTTNALAAIQKGDSGTQVSALQENLATTGYYDGPITGFFGTMTQEAVIRFQQASGLPSDGVVGAKTQSALDRQLRSSSSASVSQTASTTRLQRGVSGVEVEQLQKQLKAAGYYDGPISGFFGTLTEASVLRFQQERGLTANGIADKATLDALGGEETSPVTTTAEEIEIRRTLANGDTGADVAKLQRRLQDLNYYDGPISGVFDARTEAAVIRAQRDSQLEADGVVGADTLSILASKNPERRESRQNNDNPSQDQVVALQKRLKEKGFYNGRLTGKFDSLTKAAVEEAQRAYGISNNDILAGRF